jgi:hypothetical protein
MTETGTDHHQREWTINDDIIRLRHWADDESYELVSEWVNCLIGRGTGCEIRLDDPKVSTQHIRLIRDQERWNLIDLASKNGVQVDGVRHHTARLEPCMEIGLGDLTLIAESVRSIELRCFLARLIGWGKAHFKAIDEALREIRAVQIRRAPLVLRSEEHLPLVAEDLHTYLHAREAPFVLCDPRRGTHEANVRSVPNVQDWREALVAARGGTLCLLNAHPPEGLSQLLAAVQHPCTSPVQVIVCAEPDQELCVEGSQPIEIPALPSRQKRQVQYVIVEYARDAAKNLGAPKSLSPEDRAWILEHSATSLTEVSKATQRLTALGMDKRVSPAARRLGMSPPGLRKWLHSRPLPPMFSADDFDSTSTDHDDEHGS